MIDRIINLSEKTRHPYLLVFCISMLIAVIYFINNIVNIPITQERNYFIKLFAGGYLAYLLMIVGKSGATYLLAKYLSDISRLSYGRFLVCYIITTLISLVPILTNFIYPILVVNKSIFYSKLSIPYLLHHENVFVLKILSLLDLFVLVEIVALAMLLNIINKMSLIRAILLVFCIELLVKVIF